MRQLTIDGRQEDIPERHERMKLFEAPKTMRGQLPMPTDAPLRKRTVFDPCERHAAYVATEGRRRHAEAMVEGGWATPCSGGTCAMKPGTDYYNADFVAANPTYSV